MLSELPFVLVDDCVGRIGDRLVIQPPPRKLGPGRGTGRERNVIALPRIGLDKLDLPLCVVAKGRVGKVPGPGIDLPMGEGPPRARERVDEVPALRRLVAGQNLTDQAVGDIRRRLGWAATGRRKQCDVRIADDRDARLGLQVHPVDVLPEVELSEVRRGRTGVGRRIRAELRRVPIRPSVAQLVDAGWVSARAVERVSGEPRARGDRSRPLRECPQSLGTVRA